MNTKKDMVIIGAGGFAREVLWILKALNSIECEWSIRGLVNNEPLSSQAIDAYGIIGNDEWLMKHDKELYVTFGIGDGRLRHRIVSKIAPNTNLRYPNIIFPYVSLDDSVSLGQGCVICSGCSFTVGIVIGDFSIVNLNSTIGHDSSLGKFVTVHPGVNISGNVHIGQGSTIGTGSCIIQNVNIGCNTIIGAGSVVVKDIPDNVIAYGNPCKVVRENA